MNLETLSNILQVDELGLFIQLTVLVSVGLVLLGQTGLTGNSLNILNFETDLSQEFPFQYKNI